MPNFNLMLRESFENDRSVIPFELNRQLHDHFHDKQILYTQDSDFDLTEFAREGRCVMWDLDQLSPLLAAYWRGRKRRTELYTMHALVEIVWKSHRLVCLTASECWRMHCFIIADSIHVAKEFFEAVCQWSADADHRVTVYDGRFHREGELEKALRETSWDSLVLEESLKQQLTDEVDAFFSSQEAFARYGVAWRRGLLLYGPPGNGKTHAIKALLHRCGKPCLIVRSLNNEDDSDESAIRQIFAKARCMAPAVMVLEDIDSLVSRSHLSALLNEMDGFAKNEGLLFLATTNHLSQLDSALSNRPSRFDRKYEIGNPKAPERTRLLRERFARLDPEMQPSSVALESAVKATKGFSGASLQELVASSALAWMRRREQGGMDAILASQIEALRPKESNA